MERKKRALALLMVVIMALSMLPIFVFADDAAKGDEPTPVHVHSEECYRPVKQLVCQIDHEHTEDCYAEPIELVCGFSAEGDKLDDGDVIDEDKTDIDDKTDGDDKTGGAADGDDVPTVTPQPLADLLDAGGVTFVPVGPYNEYDVQINGEGPVITIYCLQQKNLWPGGDVVYYDHADAADSFQFKDLLSPEEVQIIRKLVFAGYPNDSQGILRKYWMEGELGGLMTNVAIWFLMSEWEKPGSESTKLDYDNINPDDLASVIAAELINYAKTAPDIVLPAADDVAIDGDFTFNEQPDGTYVTDYLQITRPTGLNLLFNLDLPDGIKVVDEYGFEVTSIGEHENFRLVAENRDVIEGAAMLTSAELKYPGDVSFYVTNQDSGRYNQVDKTKQVYQTMLYVPVNSMTVSRSFDLAAGPQKTVDVSGYKVWDDAGNQDGKRPDKIVIDLHENGVKIDSKTVTPDEQGNWTWEWTGLPRYKNGAEVVYDVFEEAVEDYTSAKLGEYSFVNHYAPGKTSLYVEKIWDDNNNQDGKRPASVTVQLLANGEKVPGAAITLTADENGLWEGEFPDLDEYKDGVPIVYTVEETLVAEYTAAVSGSQSEGYTVTNSYAPKTVNVSGQKTWDDNNDQDGKRPESIRIQLHADGMPVDSVTVTAADNWVWSFTDLPMYSGGEEIHYTVIEDEVEEYTTTYSHNSYDITNSYTPGKTSVSVSKIWNDGHNRDGLRPDSITVRLFADREYTGQFLILNDENGWFGSFGDLDEYKDGKKITYTIQETAVSGYLAHISGSSHEGYTITNSHTPKLVSVSGAKTWEDSSNQAGKRPDSITVRLRANGVEVDTATVTAADNWSWSFNDLPKYENGGEIVYTVTEDTVTDYSAIYDGYNITNSYTPSKTSITVEKRWVDNNDQDNIRPDKITVRLLADGLPTDMTAILEEDNNWEGAFFGLDVMANGTPIVYTVEEDAVDGYTGNVSGSAEHGFVITNTHAIDTVSVSGSKTWNDANNQDGLRPTSIVVRLLANGAEKDRKTVTAADGWKWEWNDLPKNENGAKITYTVSEVAVSKYSASYSGFDITNTYAPEKTSISISKVWDDDRDAFGLRPGCIVIHLLANGTEADTAVVNAANGWEWTFNDLPKYKDGAAITYTVTEDTVTGYDTSITGTADSGFTVTNKLQPVYGSLTVSKTVAGTAASTTKEFKFTVRLSDTTVNGTYGDMTFVYGIATFKLKHNQSKTATGLPAGITYTVTESDNIGYRVSKSGDSGKIPVNSTATAKFTNTRNTGDVPITGDNSKPLAWALLIVAAAAVLTVALFAGKRGKRSGKGGRH